MAVPPDPDTFPLAASQQRGWHAVCCSFCKQWNRPRALHIYERHGAMEEDPPLDVEVAETVRLRGLCRECSEYLKRLAAEDAFPRTIGFEARYRWASWKDNTTYHDAIREHARDPTGSLIQTVRDGNVWLPDDDLSFRAFREWVARGLFEPCRAAFADDHTCMYCQKETYRTMMRAVDVDPSTLSQQQREEFTKLNRCCDSCAYNVLDEMTSLDLCLTRRSFFHSHIQAAPNAIDRGEKGGYWQKVFPQMKQHAKTPHNCQHFRAYPHGFPFSIVQPSGRNGELEDAQKVVQRAAEVFCYDCFYSTIKQEGVEFNIDDGVRASEVSSKCSHPQCRLDRMKWYLEPQTENDGTKYRLPNGKKVTTYSNAWAQRPHDCMDIYLSDMVDSEDTLHFKHWLNAKVAAERIATVKNPLRGKPRRRAGLPELEPGSETGDAKFCLAHTLEIALENGLVVKMGPKQWWALGERISNVEHTEARKNRRASSISSSRVPFPRPLNATGRGRWSLRQEATLFKAAWNRHMTTKIASALTDRQYQDHLNSGTPGPRVRYAYDEDGNRLQRTPDFCTICSKLGRKDSQGKAIRHFAQTWSNQEFFKTQVVHCHDEAAPGLKQFVVQMRQTSCAQCLFQLAMACARRTIAVGATMQWTAADINHLYLTESVDEPEEKRRTFPIRHDGSCLVCWKAQGAKSGPFTAVRVREVQTHLCSDCDVIMRKLEVRALSGSVPVLGPDVQDLLERLPLGAVHARQELVPPARCSLVLSASELTHTC